jgi:hypothetical protein
MTTDDAERALLPFVKAAEDYEPPRSDRFFRDEEHIALSLTVGHLREARRLLIRLRKGAVGADRGGHA